MIDRFLSILAPHHCYSCGKIGRILCDSCIEYITHDKKSDCIDCGVLCRDGVCHTCSVSRGYTQAWYIGERDGVLKRIIDDMKFQRVKQACFTLAELLDASLPILPNSVVIVPIPTISRHKRVRGYGQAELIACHFAKLRGLRCQQVLERSTGLVQVGSTARERTKQASEAFVCRRRLDENSQYLIVDDVFTTGATVAAASKILIEQRATSVLVAVVARQPRLSTKPVF